MKSRFMRVIALLAALTLLAGMVAVPAMAQGTSRAAYKTLRKGDKGENVAVMQQRLKQLGCLYGKVDGIFGVDTYDAVRRFQATLNIEATGVASGALQQRMYKKDAPKYNRYVSVGYRQKGIRVKDLQRKLKGLGYPYVKVNGVFDAATLKAVRLFQGDNGFKETSKMSATNLKRLYGGKAAKFVKYAMLERGDRGYRVKLMQARLKALGYLKGTVGGSYDQKTASAVSAFQKRARISVTGKAGVVTLKKLYSKKAPRAPKSNI